MYNWYFCPRSFAYLFNVYIFPLHTILLVSNVIYFARKFLALRLAPTKLYVHAPLVCFVYLCLYEPHFVVNYCFENECPLNECDVKNREHIFLFYLVFGEQSKMFMHLGTKDITINLRGLERFHSGSSILTALKIGREEFELKKMRRKSILG